MHKRDLFNLRKSTIAVAFGFATAFLVATLVQPSALTLLSKAIFIEPFGSQHVFELGKLISIYIIVALAVSTSFKAQLFNIGVPGQMLAGAIIPSMLAAHTLRFSNNIPGLPFIFLVIGFFAGAFVGGLAGFLKAKFNVHEVIGTIMMNWIIFYIGKAIFSKETYKTTAGLGSKVWQNYHQINTIISIFISFILIYVIWYLFKKTKLGYKISLVGNQPSVSDYAGYSTQKIQTLTMAISGGLAGLAGVMYYGSYTGQYLVPIFDKLDAIGFNAIVVSLVSFKNPLLIAPIATIFAAIHFGGYIAAVGMQSSTELISLAFGLMMYMIAITDNWNYKEKGKGGKK